MPGGQPVILRKTDPAMSRCRRVPGPYISTCTSHDISVSMIIPLGISAAAVTCTFLYASLRDIHERRVPFRSWYPLLAVAVPMTVWFYLSLLTGGLWSLAAYFLILTVIFSVIFYVFAWINLFGGADAWALIFLCLALPTFPMEPLSGVPPLGFLPFTVLVNSLILNLFTPLVIFSWNATHGRFGPFPYNFLGFPVPAEDLPGTFGFIMEDIEVGENGQVRRRFVRLGEAIRRMVSGKGRIYTKDLRNHPSEYVQEMEAYKKAGTVWISYGIPFLVPLTAGLISALVYGDILLSIIRFFAGV